MYTGIIINYGTNLYTGRTLGPYLIATYLRQHGWDIEVVDYGQFWKLEQLKELARSRIRPTTKFIGFSYQYIVWDNTLEHFCQWLKETYPNIVLIGGSAATPDYQTPLIDYYIQGYGEYAILELLRYLFSNGKSVKFSLTPSGAKRLIPANDFYPAAPKKSLLAEYQRRDFIEEDDWLAIETSRGCVFSCDFCNSPMLGVKDDYTRDANDFKLELRRNYDDFGVKNYTVVDETFNDRTDKITKYADVVQQLNFEPAFIGFIRADLLVSRPKDREELLRMNFVGHYHGIESFNRASGRSVGKGMDPEKLKEGILEVKKYFENNGRNLYRGCISLIMGLPDETIETAETTRQWLINNWQNQFFHAWSLEITDDSAMGRDFQKYGYSVMSPEDIGEKSFDVYPWNQNPQRSEYQRLAAKSILWKNKDMDIFDAVLLAIKFQKLKTQYNFGLDCWSLASPGLSGTIEERMKATVVDNRLMGNRFNRYIKNKLNL